ncbi:MULTISPECIES: hypothetical protein [Asticcacaulis]|uniref:hypothetical protein n=1 Tax=Asticcacaulis TaxID=76890 RepID=UPI001AE30283|nr:MULTISPECIES: hypothetical protein [Asticcacaulis]MBP2159712.1 hypothetical protein [Asticcacaulis solisilvae]MDR6800461.1 hypothetical protein [Asticcacaulis sp. BE141]
MGGIDLGVVTGSVNRQYQNGYLTTTVTSATAYTWWNQAKAQTASVSGGTMGRPAMLTTPTAI